MVVGIHPWMIRRYSMIFVDMLIVMVLRCKGTGASQICVTSSNDQEGFLQASKQASSYFNCIMTQHGTETREKRLCIARISARFPRLNSRPFQYENYARFLTANNIKNLVTHFGI